MYGFSAQINVQEIEKNKKILIEWDAYKKPNIGSMAVYFD
ncbi:SRPBCC family protein [Rickettsia conorii]